MNAANGPVDRKVRGLDAITKDVLASLATIYPGKAVRLTHQFLDGTDGNHCGFVPNNFDGSTVCITGQWWKPPNAVNQGRT
jgi:hypothetical protein